jgi:lipoprotein-releasing system permease protein
LGYFGQKYEIIVFLCINFPANSAAVNLAFFIARRTAQHTPDNKPGVMERIAVISVALSVAVMILAMAVIMGFKYEVARKVTAFAAHAVVTDVRGVGTLDSEPAAPAPKG